jgi:hypothetical protein
MFTRFLWEFTIFTKETLERTLPPPPLSLARSLFEFAPFLIPFLEGYNNKSGIYASALRSCLPLENFEFENSLKSSTRVSS